VARCSTTPGVYEDQERPGLYFFIFHGPSRQLLHFISPLSATIIVAVQIFFASPNLNKIVKYKSLDFWFVNSDCSSLNFKGKGDLYWTTARLPQHLCMRITREGCFFFVFQFFGHFQRYRLFVYCCAVGTNFDLVSPRLWRSDHAITRAIDLLPKSMTKHGNVQERK